MPDIISQYIANSDNANEYAEEQVKKVKARALEEIDRLLGDTDGRDTELWSSFEIDADQTTAEYDEQEPEQRDLNWTMGLSALSAAAGIQFFLDNREPLIILPAAYRAQVMDPFNLTREQLQSAARREVTRFTIEGYQTLQSKYLREFDFLKTMSNADLYGQLQDIKALQSFDKYVADSVGYVSRMTNYPPGSPQFKEALADLTNMQATSAQQRMNRRSVEALSVERQTGGDERILMCWVLDPTSSHCTYCPERAGEIMTYGEWVDFGLPGADVCRGGDRCNCHLVTV